ncbi:YkvA family protein [Phytohalomonas tamaricis]|uniref:YkvA family protein n=1 Tax=Phytohalomonas tamaricis TaxID=2081032 RepID=UPI000D0B05AB|nr:YkvA family protein [Phytohalomonas tamaricis]
MKGGKRRNLLGLLTGRGHVILRIIKALKTFFPMMLDWKRGRYRPLPKKAVGLMVLAVLYLVSPFDLIPDFLLGWGFIDDVLISGWLLAKLDEELDPYRQWRKMQAAN